MKTSRRNRTARGGGLASAIWSPFKHLLAATGESVGKVGSTAGKIAKESVGAVRGIGNSFASHTNMAIRNVGSTLRGSRKGRRSTRRASRSSRRSNRH